MSTSSCGLRPANNSIAHVPVFMRLCRVAFTPLVASPLVAQICCSCLLSSVARERSSVRMSARTSEGIEEAISTLVVVDYRSRGRQGRRRCNSRLMRGRHDRPTAAPQMCRGFRAVVIEPPCLSSRASSVRPLFFHPGPLSLNRDVATAWATMQNPTVGKEGLEVVMESQRLRGTGKDGGSAMRIQWRSVGQQVCKTTQDG